MITPVELHAPFICYGYNCPLMSHATPGPPHPTPFTFMAPNGVPYPPPFPFRMNARPPCMVPSRFNRTFSPPEPSELVPVHEGSIVFPEFQRAIVTELDDNAPDYKVDDAPAMSDSPINFASCKERYSGIGDVRPFINAILNYKICSEMSDDSALRSFPLLLTDLAAIWWRSNKAEVTDWNGAIELLRSKYRARPQPHKIFRRVLASHQKTEPTLVFVQKIRVLLNQLPPHTLTEDTQLDLVFGLLSRRIREKVNRNDCEDFSQLLELARQAEETFEDVASSTSTEAPDSPAEPDTPVEPQPTPVTSVTPSPPVISRGTCKNCKIYGHLLIRMCRKIHQGQKNPEDSKIIEEINKMDSDKLSRLICYRCRSSNIVRLKCLSCSIEISVKPGRRPLLTVDIYDRNFDILVDTSARNCIASVDLMTHLIANGQDFNYEDLIVSVDGKLVRQVFRVATVAVWVAGVMIPTSFVNVPNAKENVLGMDFIWNAGLSLDFRGTGTWTVRDVTEEFPILYEKNTRDEEGG
uniref:Ty3 transposon capsid-like protein domain-containing protein n=1 Tax=Heliothis virescens TaxID=7102 RepID=A0A2A4JMN9_HELVI